MQFGEIDNIVLLPGRGGLVHLTSISSAINARDALHGMPIGGNAECKLQVSFMRPPEQPSNGMGGGGGGRGGGAMGGGGGNNMGGRGMGGGSMGGGGMGGGMGGGKGGLPPLERDATRGTPLERDAPQNSGLTASS